MFIILFFGEEENVSLKDGGKVCVEAGERLCRRREEDREERQTYEMTRKLIK